VEPNGSELIEGPPCATFPGIAAAGADSVTSAAPDDAAPTSATNVRRAIGRRDGNWAGVSGISVTSGEQVARSVHPVAGQTERRIRRDVPALAGPTSSAAAARESLALNVFRRHTDHQLID
jgi:hypothetical protein